MIKVSTLFYTSKNACADVLSCSDIWGWSWSNISHCTWQTITLLSIVRVPIGVKIIKNDLKNIYVQLCIVNLCTIVYELLDIYQARQNMFWPEKNLNEAEIYTIDWIAFHEQNIQNPLMGNVCYKLIIEKLLITIIFKKSEKQLL